MVPCTFRSTELRIDAVCGLDLERARGHRRGDTEARRH